MASAIAEEELRDKESWVESPFDEEDRRLLSMIYDISAKAVSGLRAPDGLPPYPST